MRTRTSCLWFIVGTWLWSAYYPRHVWTEAWVGVDQKDRVRVQYPFPTAIFHAPRLCQCFSPLATACTVISISPGITINLIVNVTNQSGVAFLNTQICWTEFAQVQRLRSLSSVCLKETKSVVVVALSTTPPSNLFNCLGPFFKRKIFTSFPVRILNLTHLELSIHKTLLTDLISPVFIHF